MSETHHLRKGDCSFYYNSLTIYAQHYKVLASWYLSIIYPSRTFSCHIFLYLLIYNKNILTLINAPFNSKPSPFKVTHFYPMSLPHPESSIPGTRERTPHLNLAPIVLFLLIWRSVSLKLSIFSSDCFQPYCIAMLYMIPGDLLFFSPNILLLRLLLIGPCCYYSIILTAE